MKNLLSVHKDWLKAKEKVQKEYEKQGDLQRAEKYKNCTMFKGTETLEQLVDLMFSPQGSMFVVDNSFPDISVFKAFKSEKAERLGVYVDKGQINLNNVEKLYIVGKTKAYIVCTETKRYLINVLHGAEVNVTGAGFSLVVVRCDKKSKANIKLYEKSKSV